MQKTNTQPEIWGGIECTINRLAGGYSDQLALSGHYDREDDIDAIAALGIAALRYPVLWEKHQPLEHGDTDFTWVASRLEQIKSHNIKPIAGLVHHGSGPEYTNLLDPHFPELLAAYARKVAERFPWINMYTPVNEPLTTARFSGMYGFWFPHEKSELAYIKMLLNQLKATVLAMKEIRKINPEALLVQTEDLGKTYSTPLLSYQAKFENDRRFYTQDILCGRFTKEHPSWNYFVSLGIAEADLEFFIENPCPPGLLGVNYYCTSERFLDENIHNYPLSTHGGNGIHAYADVEAVRVRMSEPHGFSALVNELYERYNIPVAITEAHLNCSREGQMKWFLDIYESACSLKQQGVDIRAVTSWSLLGAYGWNKLLTTTDKTYERGVFDVSSGKRRPTAMAKMIRELALTGKHSSHALHAPGWWNRDSRFFEQHTVRPSTDLLKDARPIVILGKTGTLGKALARICGSRLLHHVLLGREDADITDADAIKKIITLYNPWAIINAAGYVRVDDAENDTERCFRENTKGPEVLAAACKDHGIQFMTFSSDLVFDGDKHEPYVESDAVNPLNIYGKSKAAAEDSVTTVYPESLIIRTSAFFGPWDEYNFVYHVLQTLANGKKLYASREVISPTYVPHLADAALDLLIDEESGIWHLANTGVVTWYDFARIAAERAGLDTSLIIANTPALPAPRPQYSALKSERSHIMPSLDAALDSYFAEVTVPVHNKQLIS